MGMNVWAPLLPKANELLRRWPRRWRSGSAHGGRKQSVESAVLRNRKNAIKVKRQSDRRKASLASIFPIRKGLLNFRLVLLLTYIFFYCNELAISFSSAFVWCASFVLSRLRLVYIEVAKGVNVMISLPHNSLFLQSSALADAHFCSRGVTLCLHAMLSIRIYCSVY